jgi:hypothetical protein
VNLIWTDASTSENPSDRDAPAPRSRIASAGEAGSASSTAEAGTTTTSDCGPGSAGTRYSTARRNARRMRRRRSDTICLNGRFAVTLGWEAPGSAGAPVGLSGLGHLFLSPAIEAVVKVLDGCSINGAFWVFATGLTNVKTTLTVKDSLTLQERTYTTAQGQPFQPIQDTQAFFTCSAGSGQASAAAPRTSPPAPPRSPRGYRPRDALCLRAAASA